jgi:hypothetical protein
MLRLLACLAAVALGGGFPVEGQEPARQSASLAVWVGSRWQEWWSSAAALEKWTGPVEVLSHALRWRRVSDGVEWAEARLSGAGEARRLRLIVVRLDPSLVRLRLDTLWRKGGTRPGWSIGQARPDALVAVNAGQFPHSLPWGWVVLNGREFLRPGMGPLSVGIAFDSTGRVRWIPADALAVPSNRQGVVEAFQSYPRLLDDGFVPEPLRSGGAGVDLTHRDARAALGETRDGTLLIAVTRFDGMDGVLDFVPFGLTTPEMAAVMGALGARHAVMLDGGISSQLLIREPSRVHRWRGLRMVPMGLVAISR